MRFSILASGVLAALSAPLLVSAALIDALAPTRTMLKPRSSSLHPAGNAFNALNPARVNLKPLALADRVPMTNAQRLARGLSPNRPRFYHTPRRLAPRASPAPNPNPVCATVTGTILVNGAGIGATAFISRAPNVYGEYGTTPYAADALRVQYLDCAGEVGAVDLATLNGIADFNVLGGITGFASPSVSLGPDSDAYAYIGGVSETAPGSPPQALANSFSFATGDPESVESAIWTINPASGAITVRWVNPDKSTPATNVVYYGPDNLLLITGDTAVFEKTFGESSVVTLTFVPA